MVFEWFVFETIYFKKLLMVWMRTHCVLRGSRVDANTLILVMVFNGLDPNTLNVEMFLMV